MLKTSSTRIYNLSFAYIDNKFSDRELFGFTQRKKPRRHRRGFLYIHYDNLAVLSFTPGPIVVARDTLLKYWPFNADGFAF